MTHNYNFDRPPHVISVTFLRKETRELPIEFEETEEGDVRVTEISLLAAPIDEGDLLLTVDVDGHSYSTKDLMQYMLTGIMTLRFQKANATINPHLRGAFFVQPQAHTCIPMAMDLQQQNGTLVIGTLDSTNEWVSNTETCLQSGQSLVAINGTPCHALEAEDALLFIQTKLDTDPYLYITTTTLPPEALSGMLAEEGDVLHMFMLEQVTFKGNKGLTNPSTTRVGDYSAFVNAKQLFMAIQKSLARIQIQNQAACQSLGRGLHSFCQTVLATVLLDYARHLEDYLPVANSQPPSLKKLGRNLTGKAKPTAAWRHRYRIDDDETLTGMCQVIATCDYSANQAQALQEMLQELQETRNLVVLQPAIESFHDTITRGIPMLVSGLMQRLKEGFNEMRAVNYRKIKQVEEENGYVHTLGEEIVPYFTTVTAQYLLPHFYIRSFGDKFLIAFCEVYYDICLRILRSINKQRHGTTIQQLLMDVYHLKEIFMGLSAWMNGTWVEKAFRSIEALLKGEWAIEYDPATDSDETKAKKHQEEEEKVIRMDVPYQRLRREQYVSV